MFKNKSIAGTYFISTAIILFMLFATLGYFWIYQEQKIFLTESNKLRVDFIESQRRCIKNEVEKPLNILRINNPRQIKESDSKLSPEFTKPTHWQRIFAIFTKITTARKNWRIWSKRHCAPCDIITDADTICHILTGTEEL